jgi:hypothetical protein
VGGIESDISTVVTYQSIYHYLAPSGKLGFFLPGSIFTTPSSAGFRKFTVGPREIKCKVLLVEDFDAISPFEGVTNLPRFLLIERDAETVYPVPYRIWKSGKTSLAALRQSKSSTEFRDAAIRIDRVGRPVPGGNGDRPWLIGTKEEQLIFEKVFATAKPLYKARKGVTADRNGIYWVTETGKNDGKTALVTNAASIGKTKGIPQITARIESAHLFPLLRGQGVKPFNAVPEKNLRIILPQRGMHGDPDLPIHSPLTFKFLSQFKGHLESRSSLKRFQKGQAFYSLWSTGTYTFSPYKVLWREIGSSFAAAYIGLGKNSCELEMPVIPDHKLYFIPVNSLDEAAYLTGFLNTPVISTAIAAYAAQLSLGVSVADYLNIPKYEGTIPEMKYISDIAITITNRSSPCTHEEFLELNLLVKKILKIH